MNIILCGANGRMGREIAREIARCSDMELAAEIDLNAGGGQYKSIAEFNGSSDVIVDFSHRSATASIVDYAVERSIPLVIATTGQTEEEKEYIKRASDKIPVFFCGNMSLGVTVFVSLVAKVAEIFPYADVEIVETHRAGKADVPSGTALMIADAVLNAMEGRGKIVVGRREGARQKGDIGISSLRIGETVGVHEVRISTAYQTITLKHEAHSRALFVAGAMHAIRFIVNQSTGLYSVKNFLT